MNRTIKQLVACITTMVIGAGIIVASTPVAARGIEAAEMPPPLKPSGNLLISAFQQTDGKLDALELRNMTNDFVDLSQIMLIASYATETTETDCEFSLRGYIPARHYITLVQPELASDNDFYPLDMSCGADGYLQEVKMVEKDEVVERTILPPSEFSGRWVRNTTTTDTPTRTGIFEKDFPLSDSPRGFFHQPLYIPPEEVPLEVIEVLPVPKLCSPHDTATTCKAYVKVRNTGTSVVDLSNYRLRAGSVTSASTTANTTKLSGMVQPGDLYTIYASEDGGSVYVATTDGAVWFEDKYGLASYHENATMTPYEGANLAAHSGKSWAFDKKKGMWRWTIPSPGGENRFPPVSIGNGSARENTSNLKPCASDQFRNPATNRCKKKLSSTSNLTPCKPGQTRNPATNRCRSNASVISALKPCAPNQTRNPETNRCKKTAGSANELKPCNENQERNPETNRCRKVAVTSAPDADFPVEAVEDSATAFAGWWALGGIGLLALAYAGWEWRYELRSAASRLVAVFGRSK